MKYQVIKTITPEQGYSCAFRQWRADSHCRFVHGYALSVEMIFEAETLDARNWVIDFGAFKDLRRILEEQFDHTLCVAVDDPALEMFHMLRDKGVVDLRMMSKVGCEAFAEWIAIRTDDWLNLHRRGDEVTLVSVEVREHGSNAARFVL